MIARAQEIVDERDFTHFYKRDKQQLLNFAVSRGMQWADADDVTQEVWLRIWKNRNRFDGRNFQAWLYRITRNIIVDAARKRILRNKLTAVAAEQTSTGRAEELTGLEALVRQEWLERVRGYLGENNSFCDVLRAEIAGESVAETAKRLAISESTVYTRRFRAKQLLLAKLQASDIEPAASAKQNNEQVKS